MKDADTLEVDFWTDCVEDEWVGDNGYEGFVVWIAGVEDEFFGGEGGE